MLAKLKHNIDALYADRDQEIYEKEERPKNKCFTIIFYNKIGTKINLLQLIIIFKFIEKHKICWKLLILHQYCYSIKLIKLKLWAIYVKFYIKVSLVPIEFQSNSQKLSPCKRTHYNHTFIWSVVESHRTSEYSSETTIQNDYIFLILIKNFEPHHKLLKWWKKY